MDGAQPQTAYPTIITKFGFSPLGPALWRPGPVVGLEHRDLDLRAASDGVLRGHHLKAGGGEDATFEVLSSDAPFGFAFVLSGSLSLEAEGEPPTRLETYGATTRYGLGGRTRGRLSPGGEALIITADADAASVLGVSTATQGRWSTSQESPDAYVAGDGPRKFFGYRDLGVAAATDRRLHIHVVSASAPVDGGTGWHSHTMGQIFFVLRGWADLAVADRPWVKMHAHDAMCISSGLRHDVPAFSGDYLVLEMCVPADYDTTDAPPPQALGEGG